MKKQITHISIHQTSKVIAAAYAFGIFILFVLPFSILYMLSESVVGGIVMLVILPFLYWLMIYVVHVLGCWFYNIVAKRIGGIEFDVEDIENKLESM